jgi:hypothetical protein
MEQFFIRSSQLRLKRLALARLYATIHTDDTYARQGRLAPHKALHDKLTSTHSLCNVLRTIAALFSWCVTTTQRFKILMQ